ncbi:MAG: hypothetical protein WC762_12710 [Methylobacter sp.]|jgi:hypothetical protein
MTPDQAYERLLDVSGALSLLVVLAMLLERALALIFDYHWFQKLSEKWKGLKAPIAFFASWFTCNYVNFDVLSLLFPSSTGAHEPKEIGILITAAIVAGGSAGAITLFQGILNFSRDSRTSLIEANKAKAEANLAEANARRDKAEAEAAVSKAKKEITEAETAEVLAKKKQPYSQLSPDEEEIDGCCIGHAGHTTSDEDLPAAEGGVLQI